MLVLWLCLFQLKENSRQWGKEKQDMLTRLSEYEHGFARTSTMILHDLPVVSYVSTSLHFCICLTEFISTLHTKQYNNCII